MTDEPRQKRDQDDGTSVDRRRSLRYLAALGAGAVAGSGVLGKSSEAQPGPGPGRPPRGGGRPRGPGSAGPKVGVVSPRDFASAFTAVEQVSPSGSADVEDPLPLEEWTKALDEAKLRGSDRLAGVCTLLAGRRGDEWVEVSATIGRLFADFGLMAPGGGRGGVRPGMACGGECDPSGASSVFSDVTVSYVGDWCGGDCGDTDGNCCGFDCEDADGVWCGFGCLVADGSPIVVDRQGALLGRDDFLRQQDILRFGLALQNAASAYADVFGVAHPHDKG